MEHIKGQTVAQMIVGTGPSAVPDGSEPGPAGVALGLAHLYQKGLLHRDINPMNILVDRDGTAKLTDLGLAIDLDDMEDVVTRDGATVGTFDYISPEQARHSRQIDTRSDIYSLGCTIYHMISGRVPFPAPSLPEKLFAHQSSEPEPLSKWWRAVPGSLTRWCSRMMSKKVEDRFENPPCWPRRWSRSRWGRRSGWCRPGPGKHWWRRGWRASRPRSLNMGRDRRGGGLGPRSGGSPSDVTPPGHHPARWHSPNSDGSDYFKLDLGPSPRLSDSLSGDENHGSLNERRRPLPGSASGLW